MSFAVVFFIVKRKIGQLAISKNAFTLVNPVSAIDIAGMSAKTSKVPITKTSLLFTLNFLLRKGISPNINVICVRTDPMESPTSISQCPLEHATIEFAISGKSVPIDTSMRPIMREEIPNAEAK